MIRRIAGLTLLAALAAGPLGAAGLPAALDTLYQYLGTNDLAAARGLLDRLDVQYRKPADRFVLALERADLLLDKEHDFAGAEAAYDALATANPRHKLLPDVLYRLALSQELQEEYLDAARNYEKVATRFSKTTFGTDALDAIERCFRKNYQDRVAYVDGYPITRIEIDDRISRNPSAYEAYDRKQQLLDTMIDNRLLYAAGIKAGVLANPAYVEDLREARGRAMFSEWYERTVNGRAQPTDKEVTAAYNRDRVSRYTTPEKVHGWQIVVPTRALADSLRRLLASDTTQVWDSVARHNSTAPDKERGGDMGLFARGVQSREIENAAFRLAVGAISQPVQTKDGFVLLRVTEKKPLTVRKLDDVKSSISADLRQKNTTRLYDAAIAALKQQAAITADSTALERNADTLAIVNGQAITQALLAERVAAIPPFYRSQFDSPEGRKRILDQLILEKLLARETERQKLWLVNKVMDQYLSRRSALIVDTYRQMNVGDKVTLDSAVLMAEYKATLADFKEPTKVHVREITAATEARAEQVRRWARAGRLPPMIHGRGLLVPDTVASAAVVAAFRSTANADSLANQSPLVPTQSQLARLTTVQSAGKSLPDMAAKMKLAGPYQPGLAQFGLAFADFTREDRLYVPELVRVTSPASLYEFLGATPDSAALADTTKNGSYVRLSEPLAPSVAASLFKADNPGPVTAALRDGLLLLKTTRRDTAQKATFADIARRFSGANTRWSGGDLYWLAKDDKAHDPRLVRAAFNLSPGGISPLLKLNDSTWVFVTNEERKDAYTRPFAEVRSKIENKLRRNQEAVLATDLLRTLRAAAKVDVIMKESDFVVEPPPEPAPTEGAQPPTEPQK